MTVAAMLHRRAYRTGIDVERRTATYTAATENPVDMGYLGREVLRMSGVDLTRFEDGGPFLDSHNYSTVTTQLGSARVRVEGRELVAEVTYARTKHAEDAWSLVRDGHLRWVSVGYSYGPEDSTRLRKGESDGTGEARVTGPAIVAHRWQLHELSQTSVPADIEAEVRQRHLQQFAEAGAVGAVSEDHPSAGAGRPEANQLEDRMKYPEPTPPQTSGEAETKIETRIVDLGGGRKAEARTVTLPGGGVYHDRLKPLDEPKGDLLRLELPEEKRARIFEARRREVMARTPQHLQKFAEAALLDAGAEDDADKIIAAVRDEYKRTFKPVGAGEPQPPAPQEKPEVWDESASSGLRTFLFGGR